MFYLMYFLFQLPAAQHKTRWQRFAQERNIHKTKRSKLVWDSLVNDWVPRWGKDSLNRRKQKLEESIIELKPNEGMLLHASLTQNTV
jgi:regulator of ribosome biosynthesis